MQFVFDHFELLKKQDMYLKYANPVFWMWPDELCQSVMAFQGCMWQVTLPHILKDDMGKV